MIISNIFRFLAGCLSAWYPNNQISKNKDTKLRKYIISKIKIIQINNNNLQKTHQIFNQKIIHLLQSKNLKNFLRKNFIQKMFFLQNRLFIYEELKELKKLKKWNFYKNLLIEDSIGNPIRFFLYFKSSGNKINHVYHLSVLENELKIDLKKKIKKVFEFGGGYGCMARIFSKINKDIKYTCFDTNYVNLLQYYYLSHNNLNVGFIRNKQFFLNSKFENTNEKNDLFIANWSLSETPIQFRNKFYLKIANSKYIFICFQEKFENINNLKYFNNLKFKLEKKFDIRIIKNRFYKGNFVFKQNHYFFIGRKL
tara:strand:- start:1254 stop:2183 length:930 start_codon:yes stop_codon:yes gene_type:complete